MAEKILIIDDETETVRLISLVLQRQGFDTITAVNGKEGIDKAVTGNPALVLLDVMMPDMDGYEVCRRLRANEQSVNIPILMFSARGQVEDRVLGYEAGIDDFITKPIHPTELVARIRALLSRSRPSRKPDQTIQEKTSAYILGIVAPRGGMGATTLTLNLGIQIYQKCRKDVLCIELRPGHGHIAVSLGLPDSAGLYRLLKEETSSISEQTIEREIIKTSFGVQLLTASNSLQENPLVNASAQMERIIRKASALAPIILLDLGCIILPNFDRILSQCNEILLLTEPFHASIDHTLATIKHLENLGVGKSKLLTLVQYNRFRSDIQLTQSQVKEMLGKKIDHMVSAAPELAYQAELNTKPMLTQQPESLFSQQISKLAASILEHLPHE